MRNLICTGIIVSTLTGGNWHGGWQHCLREEHKFVHNTIKGA